jgi:hypothetical protein
MTTKPDPVFDTCDCPEAPVMWWFTTERGWEAVYAITGHRDIGADAARYKARGVLAFQVSCPTCQRVYVRAVG